MKGRPRKPIEAKVLHGTFRDDRDAPADAQAQGEPTRPAELADEVLAFWDQVVPGLVAAGLAKAVDTAALTAMCEWWVRYRKWSQALDRMGTKNKGASKTAHLVDLAGRNFDKLAAKFGLTHADRSRLRVQTEKPKAGVMSRKRA